MISRSTCLLGALLLGLAQPAMAQGDSLTAPGVPVRRYQLLSGTTVVLQNVPDLPSTAVSLVVPAGSCNDPLNRPGLCALTAQLLSHQTQHHPGGSLLVDYEEIGARFGHRVLEDRSVFWEVVPRQHLGWALDVELERLHGSVPSDPLIASDFAAVQQSWYQRTLRGQLEVLARLFPGVLASPPAPASGIEIEQFRLQNFRPQDAVITVVGSFDPAQVARVLPPGPARPAASPQARSAHPSNPVVDWPGGQGLEWDWPLPQIPNADAAFALWAGNVPAGCTARVDRTEGLFRLQRPVRPGEDVLKLEADTKREWQSRLFLPLSLQTLTSLKATAALTEYRELDDLGQRAIAFGLDQSRSGLQCLSQREALVASLTPDGLSRAAQASLRMDQAVELRPIAAAPPASPRVTQVGEAGTARAEGNSPNARLAAFPAPAFQRLERPDGSVVLVQTVRDLPLVTIRGYLLGGSLTDAPEYSGRSQLLAQILRQRFTQLASSDLEMRVSTEPSYLLIEGTTSKERLAEWLRGFATTMKGDPQDGAELTTARTHLLADLAQTAPEQAAYLRWRQLLYPPEHPWGRSQEQTLAGIARTNVTLLRDSFQQICHLNRLMLAVSGNLTAAEATSSLNEVLPPSPTPASKFDSSNLLTAGVADQTPPPALHLKGTSRLILLGRLGPSRRDHDFYAFNLLNQVLGGDPVSSRLARRLIDTEDRVSAVSSRLQAGLGPMPWVISARPLAQQSDAVLASIQQELERLASHPPEAGEIERAVRSLEGELAVSQANGAGRAGALRNLELFHLADNYLDDYAGAYRAVKPEGFKDVARRWFGKASYATVVVEP